MGNVRDQKLDDGRRVRLAPWKGRNDAVAIAPYGELPLAAAHVAQCVEILAAQGQRELVTAALEPSAALPFIANGFTTIRDLILLERSTDMGATPTPRTSLRRWRRHDLDPILAVDDAAFADPFWRFDETALRDATRATRRHLLRVAGDPVPLAYALSGVSAKRGYLQRLAVSQHAAGAGLGSALLIDALVWMHRRKATIAYVNTQVDNDRALDLYLRHGFEIVSRGLVVLALELGS